MPFDHRVNRFAEALQILKPLLREGHADFAGQYYHARNCDEVGRDPATLGVTALIGLWFSDLQTKQPRFFDKPLTGTAQEIAAAMRGYAELGVQHIMFQCEPYVPEALQRLTEALRLYRGMQQP